MRKAKPVVLMQCINFDYMRMKKDATFNRILEASDFHGITQITSAHINNPKKLHTGRVMTTREMAPLYAPNSGFRPPNTDGLLPHFAILHRMLRKTLALRIGNANAISAYERNMLDAIMKNEHFNAFDNIMDEIWNISINPLRSCGFCSFHHVYDRDGGLRLVYEGRHP
jgi:hypothetical protein